MLKMLFALLLLAIALPTSVRAQEVPDSDPGLQPGDIVEITVWERPELSGQFTVAQDGTLVHPLYQQVRVMGLPASQVQDRIRSFLSQFEANPQLVVRPLYQVALAGQVFRPNIYTVQPGTTISQVVTQAGGVTESADTDDVQLTRGTRVSEIDLRDLATVQMPVQSGDQILVKARGGFGLAAVTPWIRTGLLLTTILLRVNR
jgi:polysaccharide export outer membrane protein